MKTPQFLPEASHATSSSKVTKPTNNLLKGKKISKLIQTSYDNTKQDTKRFKIDRQFTNNKHTVVNDTKRNRKVVIFKGTNPKDSRDLVSDAALALGQEKRNTRFKNSKSIVKKVRKASKKQGMGSKLTVIGHSLGGSLAEFASNKKKDKTITVNKGAGLNQIGKNIQKTQTDIRSKNDIVSLLSIFNKGGIKKSTGNTSLRQLGKSGAHSYNLPKEKKY